MSGPAGGSRQGGAAALAVLFGLGAIALVLENLPYEWSAFRLVDDLGAVGGTAAVGFVGATVGMTVGRFGGDHAQAALGVVRLRRLALGVLGVGLLLASTVPSAWVVAAGCTLAGLGSATLLPGLYDRAARQPGRPGAGLGALTAGLRAASVGAPALIGAIAGTSLTVGAAIALVGLPAVVAFALLRRRLG